MNQPCKELKRIARANLNQQYRISMGAILVLGIIPLAAELPFSMLQNPQQPFGQTLIFYISDFLISLIAYLLSAGVIYMNLNIARKRKPALSMVFYAFKNHPDRFIITGIVLALLMFVSSIPAIVGGVLFYTGERCAFVIVRWIVLTLVSLLLLTYFQLQYALAIYLMIDYPQMGVMEALRTSRQKMHGNRLRLLYQYISFAGLHFLSIVSLGIGYLWVLPYQFQTNVNLYLDIMGQLPSHCITPEAPSFNQYI